MSKNPEMEISLGIELLSDRISDMTREAKETIRYYSEAGYPDIAREKYFYYQGCIWSYYQLYVDMGIGTQKEMEQQMSRVRSDLKELIHP